MDQVEGYSPNRIVRNAGCAGPYVRSSQRPLSLSVETSGRLGSVAIALGRRLLGKRCFSGPMRHSAELFGAASELLGECGKIPSQIEHVYVSAGPGSFTGLRIAVTLAKTMCLAGGVKVVAVDTLDVIAENASDCINQGSFEDGTIAAIIDAKRGQFFVAVYRNNNGQWTKSTSDCLMTAAQFIDNFAGKSECIRLLGEGLVYYKDRFRADGIEFFDERYWYPTAEKVHFLGWQSARKGRFSDPLRLLPNYLRRPDVREK